MLRRLVLSVLIGVGLATTLLARQASAAADCTLPGAKQVRLGASIQYVTSGGVERSYLLYIPRQYDPTQFTPVVISLHGFGSNALQQAVYTQWNGVADRVGFVAVYPQGLGDPPIWNAGVLWYNPKKLGDDVQFMRDLLSNLSKSVCVDPARIYVNGMSNGGGMTNRIACEMADQVAAVGMVSGAYSPVPGGCHPARPIPVIAFHGTADSVVNINGRPVLGFPKITTWVAEWATRNGCTTSEPIPAKGDVSGVHYTACKDNADVVFYQIEGGGHTWPGSPIPVFVLGKTTRDINATETMWAFFEQHPLN
jgi:polyhydroxybutyrate depolymerase